MADKAEKRYLGAGKEFTGAGAVADCSALIFDSFANTQIEDMADDWGVTVHYRGPLTPDQILDLFEGDRLEPLECECDKTTVNKVVLHTDNFDDGRLDQPALICGVYFHVGFGPWAYTLPGNAVLSSAVGIDCGFVSPDDWTCADTIVGDGDVTTALGIPAGVAYRKASMDYNVWAQKAMQYLVQGGRFKWRVGKCDILDRPLADIAYLTSGAQIGSSGLAPIEPISDVAEMNAAYAAVYGSTMTFLPRNARRTGSFTDAAGNTISLFSPDSTYDLVLPMLGGTLVGAMTANNRRYFKLDRPVALGSAKKLQLHVSVRDNFTLGLVKEYLAVDNGMGGSVPPAYTASALISGCCGPDASAVSSSTTFLEQDRDQSADNHAIQVRTDKMLFKWGDLYMGTGVVGVPLTTGQYQTIVQNQGSLNGLLTNANCRGLLCYE